ncbi:MgtC/SapB family protein [Lysinibacillus sp. 54212]|uniref:MgtC/SapB family protein n=1 Tax=Lysinibacillus sp. 54212 TaxID=3119829 RepID=UPI002FC8FD14
MDFLFNDTSSLEVIIKLVIAGTLSLIIGIERELKKKPVGLKTSLVIATFSCLLTIVSIDTAYTTPPRGDINITMDPLRLAAQVVSGIGFLGAGVILRKGNDSITGLTTAAMIWGAAGIGIAVGAGFYIQALITVIVVVIGIELIAPFLIKIGPKRLRMREVSLKVHINNVDNISTLLAKMKENKMVVENICIKDIPIADNKFWHEVDIRFATLISKDTISIYNTLHSLEYVEKIEIEYVA